MRHWATAPHEMPRIHSVRAALECEATITPLGSGPDGAAPGLAQRVGGSGVSTFPGGWAYLC